MFGVVDHVRDVDVDDAMTFLLGALAAGRAKAAFWRRSADELDAELDVIESTLLSPDASLVPLDLVEGERAADLEH